MTVVDETSTPSTFSESLRAATWAAHQQAQGSPFAAALVSGALELDAYAALVDQHWHVYRVLEEAAAAMASHPVAGPFVAEELARVPSLEADLRALRGEGWLAASEPLPATRAYCDRLREACVDWAGGFVAHHYTRYLGDLSGGQFIGRAIERRFGFDGGPGASFYRFDRIERPDEFKAAYRTRLDALPWDRAEQRRVIDEIGVAYRHNAALLDDLSRVYLPG
jgi:heme oxygenase (biliverdin-producing, ferredoxin)